MKSLFVITTSDHSFLYGLFYCAAFILSAGIFIFAGLRKKYPVSTWLLITLSGVLFFILGNKLITLKLEDWLQLLSGNGLPETGRSVLGGIQGLIVGLLLAKRWLKFEHSVLDNLAYALPIGFAITRLGCLFGGCCYGTETDLPWAVQYGNNFKVFQMQAADLHVPLSSSLSLPMHPTQIYDMLFCLIIFFLVFLTRKTWKAEGSRFIFAILCYTIFRFFNEFFRDSSALGQLGENFRGIKVVQWLILGVILILALILLYRENRQGTLSPNVKNAQQINFQKEFLLFISVLVFLILIDHWLAPFEMLTLTLFSILLLAVYSYQLYCQLIASQLRLIFPLLLVISLLTMSQRNVENGDKITVNGNKGWFSIHTFGSAGNYPEKQFDCDGNVTDILKRSYSTVGAGVSYHYKPTANRHLTISTNIFSDTDRSDEQYELSYHTTAMNITASYSSRYMGGTLGLSGGSWEGVANKYIPVIGLWLGDKADFFVEANIMSDYHFIGPPGGLQIGIGSGLGKVDYSVARAGLSIMPGVFDPSYVMGGYFVGDIQIKDRFTLKPSLFVGKYFGGSIGLQMHLGKNRWKSRTE